MIRRRRSNGADGLTKLVAETQDLVGRLVAENRALRARNARLEKEVARLSEGWDQLKRLAKGAPRRRR